MIEAFNGLGLALRRALAYSGIDEAMRPIILGRVWSLVAGPITMFLVARSLTPEEQGFNYTFASLLALQIFLELGFSQSVIQFTAHEAATLHLSAERTLEGEARHLSRVASLFRFFLRWYWGLAVAFAVLVGTGGFFFLAQGAHHGMQWAAPWWLLAFATALSIGIQPILHLLTGLNQVAFVNRIGATNAIALNLVTWAILLAGGKLFASPVAALSAVTLVSLRIVVPWLPLWRQLARHRIGPGEHVDFRREVLPFQGRVTFTFLTGYFVFELFTPACFQFGGLAEAGRFGMTLALLLMVTSVSQAFVSNKAPIFARCVASGRRDELKSAFRAAYARCLIVALIGLLCGVPVLAFLKHFPLFADRLLPWPLSIVLAVGLFIQCSALALTYFVRAHREEPFVTVAWTQAVVTAAAIFLLGRWRGVEGICEAYLVSWCVGTPWIFAIFRRYWRLA